MEQCRRVAITLEQCWHAVPGGTARAALGSVGALQRFTELDLVGVSARHRGLPEAAWVPTIPVTTWATSPRFVRVMAPTSAPLGGTSNWSCRCHSRNGNGDAPAECADCGHRARPCVPS